MRDKQKDMQVILNLRAALINVSFHMGLNLSDSDIEASRIVESTVGKM
jgi:hypothetical protein